MFPINGTFNEVAVSPLRAAAIADRFALYTTGNDGFDQVTAKLCLPFIFKPTGTKFKVATREDYKYYA